MSLERESLSELIQRSETFSAAADEFRGIAENLGTNQGPEIFNPQRVVGLDRIGRLRIIGRIRGLIQKETIPYFEQQIALSANLIIGQATAKAQVDIAEIRSMAEQGFLSQADLEMAEGEIERVQKDYRRGMLTTREFVNALISSQGGVVEPTPAGPEQPTPIEPAPTSEVEKLPVVIVNRRKKETESNGKQRNFSDLQWDTLLNIIKAGEEGISTRDLEQAVKRVHPESKSHIGGIIYALRYKLEADFNKLKVITTTGSASKTRYFFNADIEFIPSGLVILEGTNYIEVDSRKVELKRPELVLLNTLVSKMGQEILAGQLSQDAFGNPNTTETELRKIFASLAKKINYAWGDQSLINSGKRGLGAWYKAQNLDVSIKQAEKEVVDIEGKIAEIQRLVNNGRLTDPILLAKAQEAVKQFGGTIEFLQKPEEKRPLTLPDGQEVTNLSDIERQVLEIIKTVYDENELKGVSGVELLKKIEGEGADYNNVERGRIGSAVGRARYKIEQLKRWTIVNDLPERSHRGSLYRLAKISEPAEKKPEPAVGEKEKATLSHRENRELALEAILEGVPEPIPQEILNLFGRQRNGRSFTWPAAKSSMISHLLQISARVGRGTAGEKDRQLRDRTYRFMGKTDDQDLREVIREFESRLVAWFKGEAPLRGDTWVIEEEVVEENTGKVSLVEPPTPKLTERQAKRQEMITERVRGILAEISQVENLPDRMGSSRLTWLAKHHLGLTITDTDIQKFIDRGYIEQFPGNDHHPSYNQESLLTATYLRRFGNNMSKAQRRELLRIMSREFNAWQVQRSNQ